MIAIVDYGMGNLASIKNMLKKIGVDSQITSSREVLAEAPSIILPGVGAFDNAMINIKTLGLLDVLNQKALVEKVPVLGICLGMQLLLNSSEEGKQAGLGWINGEVLRFRFEGEMSKLKVPHMGWNLINVRQNPELFEGLKEPRFYFVHSYYVRCNSNNDVMATTRFGIEFVSAVRKGNIFGTQFHPEKSHRFGMKLLGNFVALAEAYVKN